MKHTLLLLLLAFGFSSRLVAQQLTEIRYGDNTWSYPIKSWQMPDGNLAAVVGGVGIWPPQSKLFHVDLSGNVSAEYLLPPPTLSNFIEPSADGSSFLYGRMGVAGYTIHRLDLTGQQLDSITYLPPEPLWDDYGFAIKAAPNGDVVFGYEDLEMPQGVRVVRLNPQGTVVFTRYISSPDPDFYANGLTVLPNGRTVVVVLDYSNGYRTNCYSPTGTLLWQKGVPQIPGFPENFGLVPLGNNNTAFYGRDGFIGSVYVDGYAAAYKPDGTFAYNRTFETEIPNFKPTAAFADGDALIVAGGYYDSNETGLGVIKIDGLGQTVFVKKFDRLGGDENMHAALSLNGDYVFSGFQWQPAPIGLQGEKGYVLCLQPDGTLNWYLPSTGADVHHINDFIHLKNGDMVLSGQGFNTAGSLLLHVSDLGPINSHLIQGTITLDSIPNCFPDAVEGVLAGWGVKAETANGNRYATSDAFGNYSIRLPENAAEVTTKMPNLLWGACALNYPVDFSNQDTVLLPIPVRQLGNCPYLSLDVATNFLRRCFDNTYYFHYCNDGTTATEGLNLDVVLDSFTNFIQSSVPFETQNGPTLHFELDDLAPGECGALSITVNVSCQSSLGQLHCLNAVLLSNNSCPDMGGGVDYARDCQTNIGSFDPNDKRAFVNDSLREGSILPDTDIRYQIRFQNTGTDTAFNIVVVDTIAPTLDIQTIRPGASSHPFTFQLLGENVTKFVFNNIQLPDSNVNEAASHGFVDFTIKQKPNLPLLTKIENKADIYFDYNAPITTNLQTLLVDKTSSSHSPEFNASAIKTYPNPTLSGEFWVESNTPELMLQQVQIMDLLGRVRSTTFPQRNKANLRLPDQHGVYVLKVLLSDGRWATARMVR